MEANTPAPLPERMGRLTMVFMAALVVTLGVTYLSTAAVPIERAPEITIAGFDGTTWSLHGHLDGGGGTVVVNFWASWCTPCRVEIPEISAFARAHPEVLVVGVAVSDDEAPARRLMEELDPAYYTGIDPTGTLMADYPSFGLPVTIVIGADGTILARREGLVTLRVLEEMIGGA